VDLTPVSRVPVMNRFPNGGEVPGKTVLSHTRSMV
jgi:hypothetical protein